MNLTLLAKITRLKAIADTGLLYAANEYDKERYEELKELSIQLLSEVSGHSTDTLKAHFPLAKDKRILLVKESADNKWSLPGGWADVGHSPKEVIIKEFKEETGLDVIPQR